MTTSSELVLPSPTKMRARKSRHRRNNSRGSMKDVVSPVRSPSCEAFQDGKNIDHPRPAGLHRIEHGAHAPYPGSFKYLGPATAIREHRSEDEIEGAESKSGQSEESGKNCHGFHDRNCSSSFASARTTSSRCQGSEKDNNVNDVCFGCDGGCSDATCSSKRSSQVSADVESTCDISPLPSPRHPPLETMSEKSSPEVDTSSRPDTASGSCSCSPMVSPAELQSNTQSNSVREKDSNENLNCPAITSDSQCDTSQFTTTSQHESTTNVDCCTTTNTNALNTSITESIGNTGTNNQISLITQMGSGVKRVHSSQDMSTRKQNRSPCRRRSSDIRGERSYENGRSYVVAENRPQERSPGSRFSPRAAKRESSESSPHNSTMRFRKTKVS